VEREREEIYRIPMEEAARQVDELIQRVALFQFWVDPIPPEVEEAMARAQLDPHLTALLRKYRRIRFDADEYDLVGTEISAQFLLDDHDPGFHDIMYSDKRFGLKTGSPVLYELYRSKPIAEYPSLFHMILWCYQRD
jgi:hypothetical protein